ncbi:hypothetical protein Tco_1226275 [Tanacetum coccineum]
MVLIYDVSSNTSNKLLGLRIRDNRHILNLVPTKKVSKETFEMWKGITSFFAGTSKIWVDNVVFVARRGVFLDREMISKEDNGSKIDLEEIQESADEELIVNTNTQQEVVTPVEPDDISLPIRRTSSRKRWHAEAAKWKEALKGRILVMYDNQVWNFG